MRHDYAVFVTFLVSYCVVRYGPGLVSGVKIMREVVLVGAMLLLVLRRSWCSTMGAQAAR